MHIYAAVKLRLFENTEL